MAIIISTQGEDWEEGTWYFGQAGGYSGER
jgi:hypothetical protein